MNPIISYSDLAEVERRDTLLVAAFIAKDSHPERVRWIFDRWNRYNEISGNTWHIVVPVIKPPLNGLQFRDYNYELAKALQNSYGVDDQKTPCLMRDNFNEGEKQFAVRLEDSEDKRELLLSKIAQFLKEKDEQRQKLALDRRGLRTQTTSELEGYLKNSHRLEGVGFWCREIGTAGLLALVAEQLVNHGWIWHGSGWIWHG